MHQIRFRLGFRPRPRWGSLQRSPRPLSWIHGCLLLRGRGGKGDGKGRGQGCGGGGWGGEGREGKGRERGGGEGRGREYRHFFLYTLSTECHAFVLRLTRSRSITYSHAVLSLSWVDSRVGSGWVGSTVPKAYYMFVGIILNRSWISSTMHDILTVMRLHTDCLHVHYGYWLSGFCIVRPVESDYRLTSSRLPEKIDDGSY